jgi:hypothetical protein
MSSTGKATSRLTASSDCDAAARFSTASSSSVKRAAASSRQKISVNCRSFSLNADGFGLSTLKVPMTRFERLMATVSELRAPCEPSR